MSFHPPLPDCTVVPAGRQTSPLKGGVQEGVPVPLPTSGEACLPARQGVRGWVEVRNNILYNPQLHYVKK